MYAWSVPQISGSQATDDGDDSNAKACRRQQLMRKGGRIKASRSKAWIGVSTRQVAEPSTTTAGLRAKSDGGGPCESQPRVLSRRPTAALYFDHFTIAGERPTASVMDQGLHTIALETPSLQQRRAPLRQVSRSPVSIADLRPGTVLDALRNSPVIQVGAVKRGAEKRKRARREWMDARDANTFLGQGDHTLRRRGWTLGDDGPKGQGRVGCCEKGFSVSWVMSHVAEPVEVNETEKSACAATDADLTGRENQGPSACSGLAGISTTALPPRRPFFPTNTLSSRRRCSRRPRRLEYLLLQQAAPTSFAIKLEKSALSSRERDPKPRSWSAGCLHLGGQGEMDYGRGVGNWWWCMSIFSILSEHWAESFCLSLHLPTHLGDFDFDAPIELGIWRG
ncbi:hypothetical protein DFP72DRAFT_1116598 [Ephemerocybe angulata]|uniref:Uncharacterized protein n=1 Tax=Ephemerocybe angulata TaxID=980116 RepID=A0A8H6I2U5_9AGAR|nr:hypothetical protein DFP72DRAFT_1116598 [Tulosesus angulatus]